MRDAIDGIVIAIDGIVLTILLIGILGMIGGFDWLIDLVRAWRRK
jgi:hypothetical protein